MIVASNTTGDKKENEEIKVDDSGYKDAPYFMIGEF